MCVIRVRPGVCSTEEEYDYDERYGRYPPILCEEGEQLIECWLVEEVDKDEDYGAGEGDEPPVEE